MQSTSARAWEWNLYDWSRWFDVHSVEPQSFYPGIRAMRPDVLAWYHKQGSERPIYMTQRYPNILGSQAYPIDHMVATYGREHFGCQLDYMGALALDEGFDTWILYGIGQPYAADRTSAKAQHWFQHHGTFLYWLRLALAKGVQIRLFTPEANMLTPEMIRDEDQYPTPTCPLLYGYEMGIEHHLAAGLDESPWSGARG